jgi:putative transposase
VILRLAEENPGWGYQTRGELATMGIVVAASSVWAILKRYDIPTNVHCHRLRAAA